MFLRLSSLSERLRASLFFVPMIFVVLAVVLAVVSLAIDAEILENTKDLPFGLTSTVENAREVLSTVAGATISFAGIAFSISLLVVQQASSQYSPRVIKGMFRDPFNKRAMGIVVGTFTYCLVVLRSVRSPLEQDGSPVIPNLSVALAVVFGLVSILTIIAFISHSAHTMDVSKILEDVSNDARRQIKRLWRDPEEEHEAEEGDEAPQRTAVAGEGLEIRLAGSGWIQQIDVGRLAHAADPGGVVRGEIAVGRYAIPGAPLCSITPAPHDTDAAVARAQGAVVLGDTRTVEQDVSYGIRQLADVALKALSPGVNDPTTAQDAVFHIGGVLRELLVRRPPPMRRSMPEGRVLELAEGDTHEALVRLAFDEIRLAAHGMPTVCIYLLEVLRLVEVSLAGLGEPGVTEALHRQAQLVREGAAHAGLLPHDRARIEDSYRERFGDEE